jgi:hypothetical protein
MITAGAAALFLASVAFGEDFWVKKEYVQWSDAEVKKIMTNSPWAKDITISAPAAALGVRGQRVGIESENSSDVETGGGGGRGGRGGRRGGGGAGFGGGGEALLTLNISWRSALPLRKALVRSRLGAGSTAVPPEAEQLISKEQERYVIVVTGVPAAMARLLQNPALLDKCVIRAGKKPAIAALAIDFQRRTQSVDVIYSFPKTPAITPEDKDVEVVLQLGQIEAKKKFNLKDMVYNGKLEL